MTMYEQSGYKNRRNIEPISREVEISPDEKEQLSQATKEAISLAFLSHDFTEVTTSVGDIDLIGLTAAPNATYKALIPCVYDKLRVQVFTEQTGETSYLTQANLLVYLDKTPHRSEITITEDETLLDQEGQSAGSLYNHIGVKTEEEIPLDFNAREAILDALLEMASPEQALQCGQMSTKEKLLALAASAPATTYQRSATYAVEPQANSAYNGALCIEISDRTTFQSDGTSTQTYHRATATAIQPFFDTNSSTTTELTLQASDDEVATTFSFSYDMEDSSALSIEDIPSYTDPDHQHPTKFNEHLSNALDSLLYPRDEVTVKRLLD